MNSELMQEVILADKSGKLQKKLLFERNFVEEYVYHINFEELAYITLTNYKPSEKSIFGCIDLTNLEQVVLYTSDFEKESFINHYVYVFKFTKEYLNNVSKDFFGIVETQKELSWLMEIAKKISTKSSIVEEEVIKQLNAIYN